MNLIPIKEWWTREDVKDDEEYMYIFTDNSRRTSGHAPINQDEWYYKFFSKFLKHPLCHGNSTQAVCRGLRNAFPISTVYAAGEQWSDGQLSIFKNIIDFEIRIIIKNSEKFKGIKYNNEYSFGNAKISRMKEAAPKCWEYLNSKLLEINIKND